MMNATYSPEDNKLRLYTSTRLDASTYERMKSAGFKWAPRQSLFVAPMWTPAREDLLIELCGEIGDEDTGLVERAEERADRFAEYSDRRAHDANAARNAVSAIADGIPFGQPILVGHHSERRARKDAEKIENHMRRAVQMWETSEYWKQRAAGALRHAKYKELPAVRHRRIKGLEADKRKQERIKQQAEMWLKLWLECEAEQDAEQQKTKALRIAGACWLHLPRKEGDRPDFNVCPTAYDALENRFPNLYAPRTLAEVIDAAKKTYPDTIRDCDRWIAHYENRIAYERAMLDEQGGIASDKVQPEVGGAVRCLWAPNGGWAYIQKVNKVTVSILHKWNEGGRMFKHNEPLDKIREIMSKAQVDEARAQGRLIEIDERGFYLSDSQPERPDTPAPEAPDSHVKPEIFEAMRDQLRAGVQVVSAPQLFPTPADLAARMVELADIEPGIRVLEPSAGTGRILEQLPEGCEVVAVEINAALGGRLDADRRAVVIGDFLQCTPETLWGSFDRVLMNPPFENADDIKHILHARSMLKPGGRLVAICANGPRQRDKLKPLSESSGGFWEELPAGTFKESGTLVNAALLVIEG